MQDMEKLILDMQAGLEANSEVNIRKSCIEMAVASLVYTRDGNEGYDSNDDVVRAAQIYYNFITGEKK